MSLKGKLLTRIVQSISLGGEMLSATSAGTDGAIQVLLRDGSRDIFLATGTDVPTDDTDGYAKGCRFIDTNVGAGTGGVYENVGTTADCNFDILGTIGAGTVEATDVEALADGEIIIGVDGTAAANDKVTISGDATLANDGALTIAKINSLATAAEVNQACDLSAQQMTPGVGFKGASTIYQSSVVKHGGIIKTEILIDLTAAKSSTTDLDIIGVSGVSHIGQITAALNGTILYGQMTCLETPTTGVTSIDLYTANEDSGVYDAGIEPLTETALITHGAWTAAVTHVIMADLPAADDCLYLTCGAAGTPGTYSAGRFLIELWGV